MRGAAVTLALCVVWLLLSSRLHGNYNARTWIRAVIVFILYTLRTTASIAARPRRSRQNTLFFRLCCARLFFHHGGNAPTSGCDLVHRRIARPFERVFFLLAFIASLPKLAYSYYDRSVCFYCSSSISCKRYANKVYKRELFVEVFYVKKLYCDV